MKKPSFILLILCLLNISCNKNTRDTNKSPQNFDPSKPVLLFPAANSICTTGENQTALQNTIGFDWDDANHANAYKLIIKNLLTNEIITQETTQSDAKVNLTRAIPYSWTVTAKSSTSNVKSISDNWKFYNSGPGVQSYAPFPATATYPTMGQDVTFNGNILTLTWNSSDVDNDLAGFDIYFGNSDKPAFEKNTAADIKKLNVQVNRGLVYYRKVISIDAKGNKTDSGIFQFKVD